MNRDAGPAPIDRQRTAASSPAAASRPAHPATSACGAMHGGFFVSPTGMAYEGLEPLIFRSWTFDGHWYGPPPSLERMAVSSRHLRLPAEIGAIVHTHSPHATALACTGRAHTRISLHGGGCGWRAISAARRITPSARRRSPMRRSPRSTGASACLLANHGVIALGEDLAAALALAARSRIWR